MQAFSTRSFAKGDKPEGLEPVAHLVGSSDYGVKLHIGCRIEIEHQSTRSVRMARLAIPRVDLETSSLRNGRQTFNAINLKVRFAVARYNRQLHQMGRAPHGVTLKEQLTPDSIGRPNNGARPTFDVRDHPGANSLVVARKIKLGDLFTIATVRPQRLFRPGDRNAHDDTFHAHAQPARTEKSMTTLMSSSQCSSAFGHSATETRLVMRRRSQAGSALCSASAALS